MSSNKEAGAYAWVAVNEDGELAAIAYAGFDGNLQQLGYLNLAMNYAADENGDGSFRAKMDKLYERFDKLYLVVFEKDANHAEEWRGTEGRYGISHYAAGVLIRACRVDLVGQEIVALNMNTSAGWTDPENRLKAGERDFQFYKRQIEHLIKEKKCLIFEREDFDGLVRLMK